MTDWNKISAFMAAVVAWPVPGEPGYVNLQHSFHDKHFLDGKRAGKYPVSAGKPFRSPSDLIQRAAWMNTTNSFKDQWFCLSLQREAKPDPRNAGKLRAVRSSANALALKAIWIDCDVKEKGYADINECLKALMQFRQDVGLPEFSALVLSGGGVHAYWIATEAMTPDVWRPYAEGLKALLLQKGVKCDAGLTGDQARILRMPGTLNHKYDPPKPVQLLDMPLTCYNFETQLSFLTEITPVGSAPGQAAPHALFAEGARAAFKGATPVLRHNATEPGLEAGIEKFDDTLIPIAPIMKDCGFYREALKTGGRDHDQPLWNLAVLGATFMENGNNVAHPNSSGHAGYSADDTQALYDRKVAERADRGIGYPSCAAIAGSGCQACATCPLFAKGKSPLNLRPAAPPITAAVTQQSAAAAALSLPPGYEVDERGIICKVMEKASKDGATETTLLPLFKVKLSGFWAEKNPHRLNYTVQADKGNEHMVSVPMAEMGKVGFAGWLLGEEAKTAVNLDASIHHGRFYMAMLTKLWEESASQETQPFGWHETGGQVDGFTYGGITRFEDGHVQPCGAGDENIRLAYTPTGKIEPWFEACRNVTNRKRPELTAIMLAGFAGPLVALSGHAGAILSSWGESGAGKSAAFTVGLAIWGHPLKTKGKPEGTYNGITTTIGQIKNLPYYIDEIKDDEHRKKSFTLAHDLTDGVEKPRNINGRQTQVRLTWKLPVILASNQSFREYLHKTNHQHAATINRVLEWFVKKIDHGAGHIANSQATAALADLESNYGRMGELYSSFLAKHHRQIKLDYQTLSDEFEELFKQGSAERFWYMAPTILVLAARYASQLGVDVDENEIKEWVIGVVRENIQARDEAGMIAGIADTSEEMIGRYIKDRLGEERIIWTDSIHRGKGKPAKPVVLLHGPSGPRNNMGGIEVRCVVDSREVLIARRDFETWANTEPNRYPLTSNYTLLKTTFSLSFDTKVTLLSNTQFGAGKPREPVLLFKVTDPEHPLWDLLWRYAPPEQKVAAEDSWLHEVATRPVSGETVDTGLTSAEDVVAFVQGATRG